MLTQERLKELLIYSPETGRLFWKTRINNRINIGDEAGRITESGYRKLSIDCHEYRSHRVIWMLIHGEWPSNEVDHINGIKDDNRIENLRIATRSQNNMNTKLRKDNTSGYRGVTWLKSKKKWRASCCVNGKCINIGHFYTKEEAYEAYVKVAKEEHGKFYSITSEPLPQNQQTNHQKYQSNQ